MVFDRIASHPRDHHATGTCPDAFSQWLTAPKWPQPRNGAGPRLADRGDGWLALST